ncbi:hypothetical protein EVAR_89097_1 [Eumeta japonica]|uniref:Uncharacterized protein n=1 Tax=Eumeta variegata TaxID=151549 RepID=A0A4C1XHM7_EUMVA|nr:hypothetical protein EVAR_89097_1 [Eumeta japonica]
MEPVELELVDSRRCMRSLCYPTPQHTVNHKTHAYAAPTEYRVPPPRLPPPSSSPAALCAGGGRADDFSGGAAPP